MSQICINGSVEFGERRNRNGVGKFCSTECNRAYNELVVLTFKEFLKPNPDPEEIIKGAMK